MRQRFPIILGLVFEICAFSRIEMLAYIEYGEKIGTFRKNTKFKGK